MIYCATIIAARVTSTAGGSRSRNGFTRRVADQHAIQSLRVRASQSGQSVGGFHEGHCMARRGQCRARRRCRRPLLNISQVMLIGVNLKCASCHDSFINDWQLSDAYGLANVFKATSRWKSIVTAAGDTRTENPATQFIFPATRRFACHDQQGRTAANHNVAAMTCRRKDGRAPDAHHHQPALGQISWARIGGTGGRYAASRVGPGHVRLAGGGLCRARLRFEVDD